MEEAHRAGESPFTTSDARLRGAVQEALERASEDYAAWLDPAQRDANELMRFVRPYPAERMSAYRVSPRVSKPDNDDPSLIAELAQAPAQRELL